MGAHDYDGFAADYDVENSASLLNAYYERPTVLRLAGDVRGRRILDAGCGSGLLAASLLAQGADVTGFDGSPAMIELARRRLGDGVRLLVHDLAQPLPFEDQTFEDVVASLVLHYLEDWSGPLAEIRRVLQPGGRIIASINHPFVRQHLVPDQDYFAIQQYQEDYTFDGRPAVLTMWHRPLHQIVRAFVEAGFDLRALDEPGPSPNTPIELLPPRIASGERSAFLSFLFIVAQKPAPIR
ncbi:MAG TPA: class I SAM-dependent methyltransferase [Propionicimonas sp.]